MGLFGSLFLSEIMCFYPPLVQVRSPVSDSILGEQTLVVSEEKVSISALKAQLVSGLSLTLSAEPGHMNVFTATCQGLSTLRSLKQVRRLFSKAVEEAPQ